MNYWRDSGIGPSLDPVRPIIIPLALIIIISVLSASKCFISWRRNSATEGGSPRQTSGLYPPASQNERTRGKPTMKLCDIVLKACDMTLQFRFLDYGITNTGMSPTSRVTSAHVNLLRCIRNDPAADKDELFQRAAAEIETIRLFFPDVRSEIVQICMAAWLSTLCTIDDIIEETEPPVVKAALNQSIEILLGQKEVDLEVYLRPHENQVTYIMTQFRNHCSYYLSVPVAEDFLTEVTNVCQALIWELEYRQDNSNKKGLHTYLQIRARTIGIAPFFALIRHLYCPNKVKQAAIFDLQRAVSLAAGLQNDLIGLEKDLHDNESMNAVVVALREMDKNASDQSSLREATCRILRMHNNCVEAIFRILEIWNKLEAVEISDEEFCGHVIAGFAGSHMMWCTSTKRYRVTTQKLEH
ncbi:hypothetical protein ASPBRDRAFT_49758 [Aspergillus brasiliensis CBS 101740]|uniref:Terpene synthase n=1 Tax=Aspergillus brasiliensis (strain CBS 101740 / IMI 381727 / IBT 21946) TaxID=767769 RepID=A0A1L9U1F8_ASPBC|nr:hypothetical protein ASPBRDRAFT_49758 [Aspergillus brasiliensis CBS 101740]